MSTRPFTVVVDRGDSYHFGEVASDNKTFLLDVDPDTEWRFIYRGHALPDDVITALVEAGIETVVLCEPTCRWVSLLDDWLDYGRAIGDDLTLLPIAYMSKG